MLVGQRRVGKSSLLFQLMDMIKAKDAKANIIYINKELFEFDYLKNHKDLMTEVIKRTTEGVKNYLFIDEIQDIENFEKALRSLNAKATHDIYITGSNAFLLSGELATYLSGRYIEFKVYGLSYQEFLIFHNKADSSPVFYQYLKYGGLPYLINLELNDELVFEYLKNIYAAILFKDVVARHRIRNVHLLENLVAVLLAATAEWSRNQIVLRHWRDDRAKREVDLLLMHPDGRAVAVEVKSSSSVGPDDTPGLLSFARAHPDNFAAGYVVYQGRRVVDLTPPDLPTGSVLALPLAMLVG